MPRGLGPTQLKLLTALRRHGREARLDSLAALGAGLIPDLDARIPYGRKPSRNQYTATARAVAALRRRGLVETETAGTARGRMEWHRSENGTVRPRWLFTHPSTYLLVLLSVDSLPSPNVHSEVAVRENSRR